MKLSKYFIFEKIERTIYRNVYIVNVKAQLEAQMPRQWGGDSHDATYSQTGTSLNHVSLMKVALNILYVPKVITSQMLTIDLSKWD